MKSLSLLPRRLQALALGAFFSVSLAAAPLVVTTNTALPEETVASYDSISVSGGAVLTVGGGSELTVTGAVTVAGNSQIVFAGKNVSAQIDGSWVGEGSSLQAASVSVEAGSAIHADGQGYTSSKGPGSSTSNNIGASHGGRGTGSSASTYGSVREPVALGSAAGVFGSATFGGGAIRLIVTGTLSVEGRISADGTVTGTNHSGGAGGSIWITADSLTGGGFIRANASAGGVSGGNSDSGGGRVAVYYSDASGFGLGEVVASGFDQSQDGTVYLFDESSAQGDVTVFGRLRLEEGEDNEFSNIVVEDGGQLEVAGGVDLVVDSLRVKSGGEVIAEGKNNTAAVEGAWIGEGVSVTAEQLTVDADASLHGDGQGYTSSRGPGNTSSNNLGASHGGKGSGSSAPNGYGSQFEPIALGSAAGVFGSSTFGGGAIRIDVSDTLTVNGRISVNGASSGTNHSGATGGSLWITTVVLAGSGDIQANAGVGGTAGSNLDSSGGRVALYYSDRSGFEDTSRIEAMGTDLAQDGTVFLLDVDPENGDLLLHGRVRLEETDPSEYSSIVVEPTGKLELAGGVNLIVDSLEVETGGEVIAEGKNNVDQIEGVWVGEGVSITADALTIAEGASLHGDGQGYRSSRGPGRSTSNNIGASYGGVGTGAAAPYYGSQTEPLDLGSASGVFGAQTFGGGAIRIEISGALTVNGRLSVNGASMEANHSGATGGSLWITTASLAGIGLIEANAGAGGSVSSNGDSSGGRIALYYSDGSGFADKSRIRAMGTDAAQDGTVFLMDTDAVNGDLTLFGRMRLEEDDKTVFNSITVEPTGTLELAGGVLLDVAESLHVKSGAEVIGESKDNLASEDGVWVGEGARIQAANLTVEEEATLHADGYGYRNSGGPGGSSSNNQGASYGGEGDGAPLAAYGSIREPDDLGSAAGVFGSSTFGGGALRIQVANTLEVDGRISANGRAIDSNHSGATGGSVWIETNVLSGGGVIQANAVEGGSVSSNRDSSGGRVAVYYSDASAFGDLANIEAAGSGAAERGTVYLRDKDIAGGAMTIYSRFRVDPSLVETFGTISLKSGGVLELGGGSTLKVENLILESGSEVVAESTVENGVGKGIAIEATNLTIEPDALLTADGWGFGSSTGPGKSTSNNIGASYGGHGSGTNVPTSYGDPFEPDELGSSAGVFGSQVAAGGFVRIKVSNTFTLDGSVTANGIVVHGTNHSGATGGSIWVTTKTLAGSGVFRADASPSGTVSSNNDSGGGRVAIYFEDGSGYTAMKASSANAGGDGAEEGTVLFVDTSVERDGVTVVERLDFDAKSLRRFGYLRLVDGARMDLGGASVIVADAELSLTEGSFIDVRGADNEAKVSDQWIGRGSTLVANELVVSADSTISADGRGYYNGRGPGGSSSNNIGSSYGGKGGGAAAPIYGDSAAPAELGSAAGVFGSSTFGGGAVQIIVANEAKIDGEISADGLASGTNHSGATGGSIWMLGDRLTGSGLIHADAAPGGQTSGNQNSGGGRIAVAISEPISGFPVENVSAAAGGAGADAGTISFEATSTLVWLSRPVGLLHGEATIGWVALGFDAGDTIRFSATGARGTTQLLESEDLFTSLDFDTTQLEDGEYSFEIELRSAGGEVKRSVASAAYIDNSIQWHGGELEQSETWDRSSPHVILEDIILPEGVTLTLLPGTVLKFAPGTSIVLESGSALVGADGLPLPIVLTSFYDDETLGDTNRDGAATQPKVGDWRIQSAIGADYALGENAIFRYGNQTVNGRVSGTVTLAGDTTHVFDAGLELESGSTLIIEPGAILKFGSYKGIEAKSGSSLVAKGTAARPIVFTSIRDDERGGDSNADGGATFAEPGDWRWLHFASATGRLDHTHILYGGGTGGGWSGTGAIRTSGRANVKLRNSWLAKGFYDGVLAWGGPVLIENSVVEGFDRGASAHPGSVLTINNSAFVDNRINVLIHGGSLELYNSIVANGVENGLLRDHGAANADVRNTIFWNPATQGGDVVGVPHFVFGENGNRLVDPLLLNPQPGVYTLQAGSPAIDAAAGDIGALKDAFGYPRFDDPNYANTGTALLGGAFGDLGAYEFLNNWVSPYDLVVVDVAGPSEVEVGESVEVAWTLRNDGTLAVDGPWYDTISLVRNPDGQQAEAYAAATVLVGDGETLEPGETLEISKSLVVPAAPAGASFWQVKTNARRTVLEGANVANNVTRSSGSTQVSLLRLMAGADAFESTFERDGDSFWFMVDTSQGQLSIDVNASGEGKAITEIFVGYGRLPTPQDFDGRQIQWGEDDVNALAPQRGTPIYVLVKAKRVFEPGVAVSVSATAKSFEIAETFPEAIGDSGSATLEVRGVDLGEHIEFELVSESTSQTYPASKVFSNDSTVAYPTFPLDDVPQGVYRVRARDGAVESSASTTLTVEATKEAYLEVEFFTDAVVRAGREGDIRFQYRNGGNVDLPAPMMRLLGTVEFRPPPVRLAARRAAEKRQILFPHIPRGQVVYVEHLLGISETGPAGVLRPGAEGGRYDNKFEAGGFTDGVDMQLDWQTPAGADEPFKWEEFKAGLRPIAATDEGWEHVFGTMKELSGETLGEVGQTLAGVATHLSRLGFRERRFGFLLNMQLRQADPYGDLLLRGESRSVGAVLPDLTANSIRFRFDATGEKFAIVDFFGARSLYQQTKDPKVFKPSVDDASLLVQNGDGGFTLATSDQGRLKFDSSGLLTEIFDGFASTITTSYQNGKLAAFVLGGETLMSFEYDGNGYLAKQTFRDGAENLYLHDAEGRLLKLTTFLGLEANYSYVSSGPAVGQLESISTTGGDTRSFVYDQYRRLLEQTDLGVTSTMEYPEAGVIVRTVDGESSKTFFDAYGNARRVIGPSGTELRGEARLDGRVETVWSSEGKGFGSDYSEEGLLVEFRNGNGVARSVDVDDASEYITSYRDHRGFETTIDYNEQGYPTKTLYPDATSTLATFDSRGRKSSWTNRRGEAISYSYSDLSDRIAAKTYPDASEETFVYDDKGRLQTAINGSGETAFEYDAQHRITKVTYPHGHWLSYTYNADGRRATMSDDSGFQVKYSYDALGRFESISDQDDVPWAEFEYDAYHRLAKKNLGNGVKTDYSYHAKTGQLTGVTHSDAGDELINKAVYDVDSFGVRHSKETIDGSVSFEYDGINRLVAQTGIEGEFAFVYDDAGNRVSSSHDGTDVAYASNDLDQYTTAGDISYTYDADGNMLTSTGVGASWDYEYDVAGRLVAFDGPGLEVEYVYDALGNRVSQIVNGVATHFLLDPVGDLETVAAIQGGSRRNFIFTNFGLVGQSSGGARYYYHEDGNFNITELTNASAEIVNQYRYSPYGVITFEDETVENPFTYVGGKGMERAPNGQYWAYVRQYDPQLGRFLRIDPNRKFGQSGYEYALNQPSNRFDFNGFDDSTAMSTVNTTVSTLGAANNVYDASLWSDNFITEFEADLGDNINDAAWDDRISKAEKDYNSAIDDYESKTDTTGKARKNGKHKRALDAAERKVLDSQDELSKLESDYASSKKAKPSPKKSIVPKKAADALGKGGTALSIYNAGNSVNDYMNGKPGSGLTATHDVAVAIADGIQYLPVPGAKPVSAALTTADTVSQYTFNGGFWAYYSYTSRESNILGPRSLENLKNGRERRRTRIIGSYDPNDKSTTGAGELGYVLNDSTITYRIRFENLKTASAAAQQVVVIDFLDERLDWSAFEIIEFGFNKVVVQPQPETQSFEGVVDVESDAYPVNVDITLDPQSGELLMDMKSFDPETLDYPDDPFAGFLPPNDDEHRGEGYLLFSIKPKTGLDDGESFTNEARIFFDVNEPIDTNVVTNTIDTNAPSSGVLAFGSNPGASFDIAVSGEDGAGSGVASFDIYVSVDDGAFAYWSTIGADGTTFHGIPGTQYGFYSIATDAVGLRESAKSVAEAEIVAGDNESPFRLWSIEHFGLENFTDPLQQETLWGDLSDPDEDGLVNRLERYAGLDPLVNDVYSILDYEFADGVLEVSFRRATAATDLNGRLVTTTNFVDWVDSEEPEQVAEEEPGVERVRVPFTVEEADVFIALAIDFGEDEAQ